MDGHCDLHPNADCIYEKEGEMISEDEEGCFEEYKHKGLLDQSASFVCMSPIHNSMSQPVLTTVFDWTTFTYLNNVTVIGNSTIVYIQAISCDGVIECWNGEDEKHCGFNSSVTACLGIILHLKNCLACLNSLMYEILMTS